jgi:hypothetical protein
MPLLDLTTQFKSLTYQGNGPAVQKDINNPGTKASNQIQARVDDVARVSSFLFSTRGAIFAGKQALLQSGGTVQSRLLGTISTLGNILGQVAVNGTGTHFLPPSTNYKYTNISDAASQAKYGGKIRIRTVRAADKDYRVSLESKYSMETGNPGGTIGGVKPAGPTLPSGETPTVDPALYDTMPVTFQVYNDPASLLLFRGFVTGLSDSYNGAWSPVDYVGRAESLYTYSKFARSVTFTLTVPVFNKLEQYPLYEKVNSLVSYTAPKYNLSGLPEGTFLKLRVGDYLNSMGFLNTATVTVADNVPWSDGEHKNTFLPQVLTIALNFTVIQNLLPQRFTTPGQKLPYINYNRDRELQGAATTTGVENAQFLT